MLGLGWKFIHISSEVTPNRKEVNMMLSTLSPVRKWKRCLLWRQLYDYTSTWATLKTTEDHSGADVHPEKKPRGSITRLF